MIVVVGGIQGGSGKTTVATHLAILGAQAGADGVLIDADDQKAATLVDEMQLANPALRAYAFLNRTDPRGQDNLEAAEVLKDTPALHFLDMPLGARKAFSNAAAQGLAVTELTPPDRKASAEMLTLFRYLFATKSLS